MPYLKMKNKTLIISYVLRKSSCLSTIFFKFAPQGGNDPVPFLYNFKSRYNKMCMGMRLIKSQVETSQYVLYCLQQTATIQLGAKVFAPLQ